MLSVDAMSEEVKVMTRGTTARLKTESTTTTAPEPAALSMQSIDLKLDSILTILQKNTNAIDDIKKEQKEMCTSIEHCHGDISDIKELLTGQDVKIAKCESEIVQIKEETCKINSDVLRVERDLRDLEQYSHRNNLIVYGIPEEKNENIMFVMRRLAAALHFENWSPNIIDAVHRMGKISDLKPRPIIIRFVSRLDKDMFLAKRKVHRNLKATDLGFSAENSIYVNESLTPSNRDLLKKTREVAKVKGYTHVWTANCCIYTRREKGSPAIKIMSAKDFDRM